MERGTGGGLVGWRSSWRDTVTGSSTEARTGSTAGVSMVMSDLVSTASKAAGCQLHDSVCCGFGLGQQSCPQSLVSVCGLGWQFLQGAATRLIATKNVIASWSQGRIMTEQSKYSRRLLTC
jgi:hypothetical protein